MAAHVGIVVGGFGKIPVVAVASVKEGCAVVEGDDGAYSHIGRTVCLKREMRGGDRFAKSEYGKRKGFVYTSASDSIIRGQQVPSLPFSFFAPAHNVGVEMVLVKVRSDEIHRLLVSFGLF